MPTHNFGLKSNQYHFKLQQYFYSLKFKFSISAPRDWKMKYARVFQITLNQKLRDLYEIKMEMVQEQWLQLKIKFLLDYNTKVAVL